MILYMGYEDLDMSVLNPFNPTTLFLYPLKTSENLWFSGAFTGYSEIPVT